MVVGGRRDGMAVGCNGDSGNDSRAFVGTSAALNDACRFDDGWLRGHDIYRAAENYDAAEGQLTNRLRSFDAHACARMLMRTETAARIILDAASESESGQNEGEASPLRNVSTIPAASPKWNWRRRRGFAP
jgi:hypothetical protein